MSGGSARRVLMTADTVGGVWTYALELARELCADGSRVLLATMGAAPDREQRAQADAVAGLERRDGGFRLEWMEDAWPDVDRAGAWLLDLERAFAPDVVHLNGYAHGSLPWAAPVLVAGHSCVLSWWRAVKGEAAPRSWDTYRQRVRAGIRSAGLLVAPSEAMLDALRQHHGPLPPARVIPNGRSPEQVAPGRKEPFVLTVGRVWDEAKNVAALAGVASELPWPVRVIGASEHPEGPARAFGNVHALGRLGSGETAAWLARASIYAHPARYEPFGLSALEAGLAGCALVLGDLPSLREVWGESAWYVAPDDRGALRDALLRLTHDARQREALQTKARARALELGPRAMADGYRSCYAALLAGAVPA